MKERSPYSVMEVPENCEDDSLIRRQYKRLALRYHPDRVEEEEKEYAEQRMKEINWAFNSIKNEACRKEYKKNCVHNPDDFTSEVYTDEYLDTLQKTLTIGLGIGAGIAAAFNLGVLGYRLYKKFHQASGTDEELDEQQDAEEQEEQCEELLEEVCDETYEEVEDPENEEENTQSNK